MGENGIRRERVGEKKRNVNIVILASSFSILYIISLFQTTLNSHRISIEYNRNVDNKAAKFIGFIMHAKYVVYSVTGILRSL